MSARPLNAQLKNLARGGIHHRKLRHRVFNLIRSHANHPPVTLSKFLNDKFFKLEGSDWRVLSFDEKDWDALGVIKRESTSNFDAHYVALALGYIEANADRVTGLYQLASNLSEGILGQDVDALERVISEFDEIDRQSLLFFRIISAHFANLTEQLEELLRKTVRSGWAEHRFIYPLIFHALNKPVDSHLEGFLSYVTTGYERDVEKTTLAYLIRDDRNVGISLGARAYIGLACHPFDVCEQLLNYVEFKIVDMSEDRGVAFSIVKKINAIVPSHRSQWLLRLLDPDKPKVTVSNERAFADGRSLAPFPEESRDILAAFLSGEPIPDPDILSPHSELLNSIWRMRCRRYPDSNDFDKAVTYARAWWFCDGGRILYGLLTLLYMFPRRSQEYELRDLLRVIMSVQQVHPVVFTGPSGHLLSHNSMRELWQNNDGQLLEELLSQSILGPYEYLDRLWINSAHLQLRGSQASGRVGEWMEKVADNFPIQPSYLSGVDWSWVQEVINSLRIRPFINRSGFFVMLLKRAEGYQQDSVALRVIAEHFCSDKSIEEFVDWLMVEYGAVSVAFVRYLLTPGDILNLKLAPNRTAALVARINQLQRCVKVYEYSDVLPKELFEKEWQSLSTELLLMSVHSGHFEVPWDTFEKDVSAKHVDLYTTSYVLKAPADTPAVLSDAKVINSYQYRNGVIVEYKYPNKFSPIAALIIAVIDDFIEHPTFGLEVLLSTRFRHDTMRREYALVLSQVANSEIQFVTPTARKDIVKEIQPRVLSNVDRWLNRRMHSTRPDKPDGLFDLLPSQTDLEALIEATSSASGVSEVISIVRQWLQSNLEGQLPEARSRFLAEVSTDVSKAIEVEKEKLISGGEYRTTDVDRVVEVCEAALARKTDSLRDWFECNSDVRRTAIRFSQLVVAAATLFEGLEGGNSLEIDCEMEALDQIELDASVVRACFDMLREIFSNVCKHSHVDHPCVNISLEDSAEGRIVVFRNLTSLDEPMDEIVEGHPYESLNDVIFREGESGRAKIASMTATVAGKPLSISLRRHSGIFEIKSMLWPSDASS